MRARVNYKEDNESDIDKEYMISDEEVIEISSDDDDYTIDQWMNDMPKDWWKERKERFLYSAKNMKKFGLSDKQLIKRYRILLKISPYFLKFIKPLGHSNKQIYQLCQEFEKRIKLNSKKKLTKSNTESSRDYPINLSDEEMEDEEDEDEFEIDEILDHEFNGFFDETPKYINNTQLRDYQINGLNWMVQLHKTNLSGILADEMGLGKTLQSVSFLGYLREYENIDGPFLVIAPKSTLQNWQREFEKWTPQVRAHILQGDKTYRYKFIHDVMYNCKFDVLITSFEILMKEKNALKRFLWRYIVIDEAHRIKNEESLFSRTIRSFHSLNRLLVTGTPLQNNLHELWALLNFILPDIFENSEIFDELFNQQSTEENPQDSKEDNEIVKELHSILSPFLLRRIKADVEKALLPKIESNVYVGMTDMQKKWYRLLLTKDIDALNTSVNSNESKTRLLNIVMQLRKCCNHPYLFDGAEPGPPYTLGQHLIDNSAKMIVLDKLLELKKSQGSRVLIFSQMARQLDILEDFCYLKGYKYCRIDGQTTHEDRIEAIDDYNAPDSDKFIFLLTTRAGGLGINLVTADTVVIYDSDWNPQADLQAMDRAHRIGQKKQVYVYRLITENAIEEKIIERAKQKLRLDQLVIQQGLKKNSDEENNKIGKNKDELLNMIQFGADEILGEEQEDDNSNSIRGKKFTPENVDIEELLKKSMQKTEELNKKFDSLGLQEIQNFSGTHDQSSYEWNGVNFQKQKVENNLFKKYGHLAEQHMTRERKKRTDINYAEDGGNSVEYRAPKYPIMYDFQFYPKEIHDIYEKEMYYYRKMNKFRVNKDFIRSKYENKQEEIDSDVEYLGDDVEDNEENKSASQPTSVTNDDEKSTSLSIKTKHNCPPGSYFVDGDHITEKDLIIREQEKIDNATEFTEEDKAKKELLLSKGFSNWTRRDFSMFVHNLSKLGRTYADELKRKIPTKTPEEVEEYTKVFFERFEELENFEKIKQSLDEVERKIRNKESKYESFNNFMKRYANNTNVLHDLPMPYMVNTSKRTYTELEDRFLLIKMYERGGDYETKKMYQYLKSCILGEPIFSTDWYFVTRTESEIGRRVNNLLLMIKKYEEARDTPTKTKRDLETAEELDNTKKIKKE
ncbi:related to ISWI chromatin-remodeling complex ATPase ISW2 [Hanseniaspora guilliermondii]|uniref:Related to ISWI chromatin-remodeling complex ATPase ISW2 n=1 Tax=Hanseniaspora guilliermondii TaxID=56406 RepID=A0A1L0AYV4_9ASCO|nr:related to ISWI chromatin-remodeling complex ATPase ISW2 [Hanseniaspora guilliermondii]